MPGGISSSILGMGWDDLRAPATAINPPGQVSDPDWDNTYGGWLFDPGATETLWIILQFSHNYWQESYIVPHLHWKPTTVNVGVVLWRLEYSWFNDGEVQPGLTTLNVTPTTSGTAYEAVRTDFASITGTGKHISSIFKCKVSRIGGDGSDTYTGDALLDEFDIHYQQSSQGSDGIASKSVG